MSAEQEELNLSELVGNLLAAHNEDELPSQLEQDHAESIGGIPDLPEHSQAPGEFDDEDLAAVVAQAIGGMEGRGAEVSDDLEATDRKGSNQEDVGTAASKEEEWAQILQQGLLQESQLNAPEHIEEEAVDVGGSEHLDNEDEALRRAILESLQGFNVTESQQAPKHTHEPSKVAHKKKDKEKTSRKDKSRDKKAKKGEKVVSSKKKSAKKKKESSKKTAKELPKRTLTVPQKATTEASDGDLLNFEDVIKGFMEQAGDDTEAQSKISSRENTSTSQGLSGVTDAETRSLVESTLRAFENELLFGSKPATGKKSTSHSRNKPQVTAVPPASRKSYEGIQPIVQTLPLSKPKKSKQSDQSKKKKASKKINRESEYNEDDFSKALADMVNQVVNTTLSDFQSPKQKSSGTKTLPVQTSEVPTKAPTKEPPLWPADPVAIEKPSSSGNDLDRKDDGQRAFGTDASATEHGPSDQVEYGSDRFSVQKDAGHTHDNTPDLSQLVQSTHLEEIPENSLMSFPDAKQTPAPNDIAEPNDNFDLNQIMQNAMEMAFHGQVEQQISQSDLNDFNKQLQGYNVPAFMDGARTSSKAKKKSKKKSSGEKKLKNKSGKKKKSWDQSFVGGLTPTAGGSVLDFKGYREKPAKAELVSPVVPKVKSKKAKSHREKALTTHELSAALHAASGSLPSLLDDLPKALDLEAPKTLGKMKKTLTPQPMSDKFWRKKYKTAVAEAAAKARRQRMDRNKATRKRLKEDRHMRRQERHKKREEERSNEEKERKKLEIIVARGPPYPLNLRLTKKGTPKKPYRWLTADEMKSRLSTYSEEGVRAWKSRVKGSKYPSRNLAQVTYPRKIFIADNTHENIVRGSDEKMKAMGKKSAKHISNIKLQSLEDAFNLEFPLTSGENIPVKRRESASKRAKKKGDIKYESVRSSKTIVHREKVAFHPPWMIPKYPPLALPVARRKKKVKVRTTGSSKSTKSTRRDGGRLGVPSFIAGNKIVSSSLFPIINTLKAAARAKAAAGATPEEASKHLGAMLRNARLTIAQVLARARGRGSRDYGSMKTLDDVKSSQGRLDRNKVKTTPLFSLGSIKAIREQSEVAARSDTNHKLPEAHPQEDEELVSKEASSINVAGDKDGMKVPSARILVKENNESENRDFQMTAQSEGSPMGPTMEVTTQAASLPSENRPQSLGVDEEAASNQVTTSTHVSRSQDPVIKQEANDPPLKKLKTSQAVKLEESDGEPLLADKNDALSKGTAPPPPSPPPPTDELPPEVKAELTRAINDIVNPPEKNRKKYTRRTTPVLNLEGLVPPASSISKIKPEGSIEASEQKGPSNSSVTQKILTPLVSSSTKTEFHTKTPVPSKPAFEIKYKFDIPTRNIDGHPMPIIPILKRAKNFLSTEDLTKLKKAMTNERKRKWREVNATKNKDHDLRARLKKRANALFGSLDSTPKTNWFNQEYSKRSLKLEAKTEDSTIQPVQELSTSITDHEVLNMIVCLLDKEDVARAIEKQIKIEASKVGIDRKGLKKKMKTPLKVRKVEAVPFNGTESSHQLADKSPNEPKNDIETSQGHISREDNRNGIATDTAESIDPVFSQMAKRARADEEIENLSESKRARTDDFPKNELLKKPAYINLGGTD
ncbi:LAFA_0E13828g1_1 [Lachancea sp. 'fantastica']|nr:LAFA_0E13828g1_1 [Lachancea sp. 'fantastica']